MINNASAEDRATLDGQFWSMKYRKRSVLRTRSKYVAVDQPNIHVVPAADPCRALYDSVQHRLNVGWRAGDDTENFTRCSLLLQRLFELIKQPHVFDGDDSLVRKGFEEFDLHRSERPHLDAACGQPSNELC